MENGEWRSLPRTYFVSKLVRGRIKNF